MGRRTIIGKKKADQKIGKAALTFTVAECGEYHSLGKYYEGIKTLEKAVDFYQQIPPEHLNANGFCVSYHNKSLQIKSQAKF